MQIYLPIAGIPVDALWILCLGAAVGFLSGLFGIGGGFLMTPLLIFIGIPPAVAVGTQPNQLVAASLAGVMAHWRRNNVDIKMGIVMMAGSAIGTLVGVLMFSALRQLGQIDLVISLTYILLLGGTGNLMLIESSRSLLRRRRISQRRKLHQHIWLHGLPFKMRFPRSRLYISALLPGAVGLVSGLLVSTLGISGGFLMVPAMIYLVGMPTAMVAGTSLFQIIFTTAIAAFLQAVTNHTVDIVLALLLLVGSVTGAQFGSRIGGRLRGDQARFLLGTILVAVALKLAWNLIVTPVDLYSVSATSPT